ncbi:MAG TPA: type II toxin-antitoxin system prevent-host-death family antitoxin [Actinokineospora sp.]|nr:type II toxin-antitoxin system prevent-host-death family antitoxin [Actinokineospora sp.]
MTAAANHHHTVGMRELSQRTAKVLALVRAGETVEVTDRGMTIARIVPAANARYDQLVAAGLIRQAARPFDVADLPEPVPNSTGRSTLDWLEDLRGDR